MLNLVLSLLLVFASVRAESRLVIRGGMVVDGSGKAAYRADVAVREGRIVEVGEIDPQRGDKVISAEGKIVAPGFIDVHNHSSQGILEQPQAETQVSQGITTLVVGADGSSPFPLNFYFKQLAEKKVAPNVAVTIGHGTVRRIVLGDDYKRPATQEEVETMTQLVRLAMKQGAMGLSTGLEYDPGFYSETSEIVALAGEAAAAGGFYTSHIRDEEEGFREALREAIEIGRRTAIPIHISHLKLGNKNVWGKTAEVLQLLHDAQREGIQITADCYPYNAWSSSLSTLVPSRKFEDPLEVAEAFERVGGADKILITRYGPHPAFEFKSMAAIAREQATTPVDLFSEMMKNGGANIVCHSMSEEDVYTFYRDPLVMVASDGGIDSRHPRKAGTFTRVLGRFVREKGLLTLENAILKMTAMPARLLKLRDRGLLQRGYRADIVVFDPVTVNDRSTFQDPDFLSEGIELTLVNGVPVWQNGSATGQLPGEILLGPATNQQ